MRPATGCCLLKWAARVCGGMEADADGMDGRRRAGMARIGVAGAAPGDNDALVKTCGFRNCGPAV